MAYPWAHLANGADRVDRPVRLSLFIPWIPQRGVTSLNVSLEGTTQFLRRSFWQPSITIKMNKSENVIFIEDADALSLSNSLAHELVDKCIDSLAIKLVLPPAGNVQKVIRAGRSSESERVVTVVFHIVQYGLGDALVDEYRLATRNIGDLGDYRVERDPPPS